MSNSRARRRATGRAGLAKVEAEQAAWRAEERERADAQHREGVERRRAAREAEAAREKLTADDVSGARVARVLDLGWMRVVRTSAKSVTVAGPMGDFRVSIDRVLEVRS